MSTTINQIQGQFTGFYFLISFLNLKREFIIFMALSICLHILGPKYRVDDTHFESGVEGGGEGGGQGELKKCRQPWLGD